MALCEQMRALGVSQLLGILDDQVWRALNRYVVPARAREDCSTVRWISANERDAHRSNAA